MSIYRGVSPFILPGQMVLPFGGNAPQGPQGVGAALGGMAADPLAVMEQFRRQSAALQPGEVSRADVMRNALGAIPGGALQGGLGGYLAGLGAAMQGGKARAQAQVDEEYEYQQEKMRRDMLDKVEMANIEEQIREKNLKQSQDQAFDDMRVIAMDPDMPLEEKIRHIEENTDLSGSGKDNLIARATGLDREREQTKSNEAALGLLLGRAKALGIDTSGLSPNLVGDDLTDALSDMIRRVESRQDKSSVVENAKMGARAEYGGQAMMAELRSPGFVDWAAAKSLGPSGQSVRKLAMAHGLAKQKTGEEQQLKEKIGQPLGPEDYEWQPDWYEKLLKKLERPGYASLESDYSKYQTAMSEGNLLGAAEIASSWSRARSEGGQVGAGVEPEVQKTNWDAIGKDPEAIAAAAAHIVSKVEEDLGTNEPAKILAGLNTVIEANVKAGHIPRIDAKKVLDASVSIVTRNNPPDTARLKTPRVDALGTALRQVPQIRAASTALGLGGELMNSVPSLYQQMQLPTTREELEEYLRRWSQVGR